MAEEIVASLDGKVRVRDSDGRFQPVPVPTGFTQQAFRNIVLAYDNAYRLVGMNPTLEQVHQFWPRIPVKTYAKAFLTDEFKQALRYRGIEWDPDSGLSEEQSMALLKMTDWTDRRSTGAKLKELGIPYARWQAWQKNPLFAESYRQRTEANMADAQNVALNALMAKADSEDVGAIKLLLEITGRWNPAQMAVEDARTVVEKLLEAVIRRADAPTRQAILADVELVMATLGLVQPRALEA